MQAPADLVKKPWRNVEPTASLPAVQTMISPEERLLLYWLTRDYWTEAGAIVDGGAFLGGSTSALAAGVRDRPAPPSYAPEPIVSFDRFTVEEYMVPRFLEGLSPGESFEPLFRRNLGSLASLCDVRSGDISELQWDRGVIEILFLDVLKTWPINDLMIRELFPHLITGRSIVVQQDELYAGVPWINITMELLGDYFERLDEIGYGATVYRLKKSLPDLSQMRLSRDLPAHQKLGLMNRVIARESGEDREMMRLSRVVLFRYLFGEPAAEREFARVAEGVELSDAIRLARSLIRAFLDDPGHAEESAHHATSLPRWALEFIAATTELVNRPDAVRSGALQLPTRAQAVVQRVRDRLQIRTHARAWARDIRKLTNSWRPRGR